MIKMIRSTYGLPVNGVVKPMDKNSGPFSAGEAQEKRLVERGYAVYVDEVGGADISASSQGNEIKLDEMKADALRAYGKELGLTLKVGLTKAEMVDAIRKALAEAEETPDDEDIPGDADAPDGTELEDADAPKIDATEAIQ